MTKELSVDTFSNLPWTFRHEPAHWTCQRMPPACSVLWGDPFVLRAMQRRKTENTRWNFFSLAKRKTIVLQKFNSHGERGYRQNRGMGRRVESFFSHVVWKSRLSKLLRVAVVGEAAFSSTTTLASGLVIVEDPPPPTICYMKIPFLRNFSINIGPHWGMKP